MPFLRRRGVMASESDMRRHTSFFSLTKQHQSQSPPPRPETAIPEVPDVSPYSLPPLPHFTSDVSVAAAQDDMEGIDGLPLVTPSIDPPQHDQHDQLLHNHDLDHSLPDHSPPDSHHGPPEATRGGRSLDSDISRPESPPVQEQSLRHRRFSLLRFRNASDSQLSTRARQHAMAEDVPPVPRPPEIITTAPTFDLASTDRPARLKSAVRPRKSGELSRIDDEARAPGTSSGSIFPSWPRRERRKSVAAPPTQKNPVVAFADSNFGPHVHHDDQNNGQQLPAYGDDATALALPVNRLSESSRSDGSSGDRVYGSTTTTTHTVHTTTTFFRLPRRRKNADPAPLFPIGHLPQKSRAVPVEAPPATAAMGTPKLSDELSATSDPTPRTAASAAHLGGLYVVGDGQQTPTQSRPTSPTRALSSPSGLGMAPSPARALFNKGNPSPASAFFRPNSRNSGRSSPTRSATHGRGRSSTLSSLGRDSLEGHHSPPTIGSSASATGRKSFGDLLGLSRLRQNSELSTRSTLTPATPGSVASKNNSLHLARDSITLPERRDDDTPAKYLARLEEVVSRSVIASALSKSPDLFSQAVLRSYMRSFRFFGDPMDMAIRKLLMEAELPKETQQIDRCLQAFANRYDECNPGIYSSPDQAYFIAFSLLILHTDVFNKNNKHKMQKQDYLKNTRGEGIFDEILDVFYDNITYTPFIHVEDDFDINGDRIIAHNSRRKLIFPNTAVDVTRKPSSKEPIDPYTLIIDNKLDTLRPNLRDVMQLEDPYSYMGSAPALNMKELQSTFFRTGILQIVSARSRPDAFMTEKTATNPEEAHPGIVDIKITKVGMLWRKDVKKKKGRSPWQEWGAILTGAQLYFFRNTTWVKSLLHQYEAHVRHGQDGIPVIFKPPLQDFKPDALISTDGAVALLDASYKKHKHAFTYVRRGGDDEVLLADNEEEMNDWLAKLNYAAAFRTSGVRIRGAIGSLYEGQNRRVLRRLGSDEGQAVQTPSGEVTITRSRIDKKMADDILAARRDIMKQKVADANEKLVDVEKRLEVQLRNSRHLQIMSPIQPKTREQMLHAAARMATQVKWTRVEMWRLKCHRDILEMDLDEEHQAVGPNSDHPLETGAAMAGIIASASDGASLVGDASSTSLPQQSQPSQQSPQAQAQQQANLSREESKASSASTAVQRSPRSAKHHGSLTSGGSAGSGSALGLVTDSPLSDVFQTPTSTVMPATALQHKHHRSADLTPTTPTLRKGSVSSAVSSGTHSITATPPRVIRSAGLVAELPLQRLTPLAAVTTASSPETSHPDADQVNAEDADEQDLLQKKGLLEPAPSVNLGGEPGGGRPATVVAEGDAPVAIGTPHHSHHHHHQHVGQTPSHSVLQAAGSGQASLAQHDKNKIRRSFQRTLRESAGHLSHHRSRKTKEGVSNGVADETASEPGVLERGAGSFVVHGKKASVISFGGDLQSILPSDERLRQRMSQQQAQPSGGAADAGHALTEDVDGEEAGAGPATPTMRNDFQAAVSNRQGRERRESATSTSTATARSFQDLHRKYSSVRAASRSSVGGRVSLQQDDESEIAVSEVAVSASEAGQGAPLTPALEEAESGNTEGAATDDSDDEVFDDVDDFDDSSSYSVGEDMPAQFFTPDPPASPEPIVDAIEADIVPGGAPVGESVDASTNALVGAPAAAIAAQAIHA